MVGWWYLFVYVPFLGFRGPPRRSPEPVQMHRVQIGFLNRLWQAMHTGRLRPGGALVRNI